MSVAALFAAGCATSPEAAHPPASISIVQGSPQTGFVGLTLSQALIVKVTAADGTPLAGQAVDFTVTGGQATLNPTTATTAADGTATTQVTLGSTPGPVTIVATVRQTTLTATFNVTAQANSSNITCTAANTITLAVGQVQPSLSGSGVCIHASAASEFVVNGFFASTVTSAQTQVGVTGFGITTPGPSPSASLGLSAGALLSATPVPVNRSIALDPRSRLDLAFRNMERTVIAPRMAAARAALSRQTALRSAAAPSVGQILQFNVDEECDTPTGTQPHYRFGRVVAVTTAAIVVADTSNPAGGFTDAEYQSIGVTFDTLVDPLDRGAFGAPTDIDGNGHVILFYTSAVNALTPSGSQGVIEGYFNPRDLISKTPGTFGSCNASNFAEMFYLIVPDTGGTINNNKRTKAQVQQDAIGVTAHEYQHLINEGRRLYVNNANVEEEVWLNEGLSHIAEELLYYHAAGLTPRQDIDATAVRSSPQRLAAVNNYQLQNLARYELFLENPTGNSPYAANDSLPTRGATWSLLRYAADHQGTSDGTVWFQLVNSTTSGLANLSNVFGANFLNEIRDWSMAVYTDDLVATTPVYQQPSWNFRSLLPLINGRPGPVESLLSDGVQSTSTLAAGGSVYNRLAIAANATAAVAWAVSSPNVQISIVRTK